MGSSSSKADKNDAVRLCEMRTDYIKQAIDSRNNLAVAHVAYITSLKNIGCALRRFAEVDTPQELEAEKTPSQTSYLSPSPSHLTESPFPTGSPVAGARVVALSYNEGGKNAVTVELDSNNGSFASFVVEDDSNVRLEPRGSWDFFNAEDDGVSFTFEENEGDLEACDVAPPDPTAVKGFPAKREDSSEFITHRAKDFVSSMKDIEHRFIRASESGKEVARMLEAGTLRFMHSRATEEDSLGLKVLMAMKNSCCGGKTSLAFNDPTDSVGKVIDWKRTASFKSNSSRTHFSFSPGKDNASDSGSDFVDDFMISGSHSSTLERLYAWERKLLEEVKASDSIRKEYERKVAQLKRQSSNEQKIRASVKDLHSRTRVAIHSVDMTSKKIARIRDDEVHHQLVELLQGLVRMWKTMVECHHAQYITISLAYHARSNKSSFDDVRRRIVMSDLLHEVEGFGLSFSVLVNCHAAYVEYIHGWLQNGIVLATNERGPLSPPQVVVPPIFVLCRDWLAGTKSLHSGDLCDSVTELLSDVKELLDGKGSGPKEKLHGVSKCLSIVLDRLHRFSEDSLKAHEDVLKKSQAACSAYSIFKPINL